MWNVFRLRAFVKFVALQLSLAFSFSLMAIPAHSFSSEDAESDNFTNEIASMSIPMTPENNRWAYDLINSDEVNALGITGSGVRIALLDNGIDIRDARIASKVVARFDATHSVSGQYDHGTATSSIISADPLPEAGIGGVAPGASILDVRVCLNTQCRNEWIVDGLKWAIENDADVISMSIAGSGIDAAVTQLINDAISQGISVVVAAGNQACAPSYSNGNQTWIRNCTQTTMPRSFPGSLPIPGLLTVGAIGRDLTRNSYSNYGSFVDVVAPGTDVATIYPWGPNAYFGGTSAATPMVAGIVALIKQASPNLTPAQIQAVLQATTTAPVTSIPNLWDSCTRVENLWECSGLSPARWPSRFYTGAGVVDAQRAVQMAQSLSTNSFVLGLTVIASDSALTLDWVNASLGSAPYSIHVDGKKVADSEVSQFTISNLTNDTQYSIQVISNDQIKTEVILATPLIPISIAAPSVFQVRSTSDSLLFNTREPVPSANGVIVLDNGDRAPCSQTTGGTFVTCNYVMQSSLVTGQFRFVDEFGNLGNLSSPISWSSSLFSVPAGIEVEVTSRTQVSASWSPVNLATSYCYYDAGQGAWVSTSQTSVQISGVLPGMPQTFSVFASDQSCRATGHHSPTYWYLPFSAPLTAPTDLSVQEINAGRLRIGFTPPAGVDSYAVYRSDGKNWITGNAEPYIEDLFANSDQGRSFTYRITAIESETYGSQYGETSSGLRISVPRKATSEAADLAARTISAKKKYVVKPLAKKVGVTIVSSKATVSFKVAKSSSKICTKSGSKLKTLKAGNCIVTFTVQEPKPKKGKKPKATRTIKTLVVQ
jgi:subtilisin